MDAEDKARLFVLILSTALLVAVLILIAIFGIKPVSRSDQQVVNLHSTNQSNIAQGNFHRFVDTEYGFVCYAFENTGITCMPIPSDKTGR